MDTTSLISVELKLELLNKKVDTMIELFEKTMAILERRKTKKENDVATNYSFEEYKESVLVKFSYNVEFKNYIKELGGVWLISKKGWMFPKSSNQIIQNSISTKFPDWKLV